MFWRRARTRRSAVHSCAIAADQSLSRSLEVTEVVVIVDTVNGVELLRDEALARRQISCADCLIVAKADAVESRDVVRLLDAMQRLNPAAVRFGAVRGVEAPLPNVEASFSREQREALNDADVGPLLASEIQVGDATWPAFAVWLSALLHARGDELLRIKGVVVARTGRLLIQAVRRQVQPPERLPGPATKPTALWWCLGAAIPRKACKHHWTRLPRWRGRLPPRAMALLFAIQGE